MRIAFSIPIVGASTNSDSPNAHTVDMVITALVKNNCKKKKIPKIKNGEGRTRFNVDKSLKAAGPWTQVTDTDILP